MAAERALRMAKEGKIITTDGSVLAMQIDTICVHGDNPSAVELVRQIRTAIEAEGIAGCTDGRRSSEVRVQGKRFRVQGTDFPDIKFSCCRL